MTRDLEKICIRPVVDPEGYTNYERVCQRIAKMYSKVDLASVDRAFSTTQHDSRSVSIYTIIKVAQAKCPAYWISQDLLTALMQSEMDLEPENLKWAMKSGIIMLPNGVVQSPKGIIQAILWHITDNELYWVALCGESIFCRRFAFNGNRKQFTDSETYSGKDVANFNDCLQPIFLRIMVLMETRPELIEQPEETVVVNKGFAKNKAKTLYQPQWIGRQYQFKTQAASSGGTHASLRMDWQRGFLRSQPCGEGLKQRKLVWSEPTLVMAVADSA